MKNLVSVMLVLTTMFQASSVVASKMPVWEDVHRRASEFASQYPYKEGDVEKSFSYPDASMYSSGFEKRDDGVEYECPGIYHDDHAMFFNSYDLKKGYMTIITNGVESQYSKQCMIYNGRTLVPYGVFEEIGCDIEYDEKMDVLTISQDDVVLEIMPYMIGMRKNKAEGFYVPLSPCARYVDDILYVPVRAVANELSINVGWDGDTYSVYLTQNSNEN